MKCLVLDLCIIRFGGIGDKERRMSSVRYLLNLCVAAVETDKDTGTRFSTLLSSVCSYKTFPFYKDIIIIMFRVIS